MADVERICSVEGCDRVHMARGWCNPHYLRWYQTKTDPSDWEPDHRSPVERFWAKVRKGAGDACWIYGGEIKANGYGRFDTWIPKRRHHYAHRFAYELIVGPIPEGLTLDHLCRNRACVNPTHLEPVSLAENLRRGFRARKNT